ncbi:MAG TPA: RsmD family RNA methyltransferase, partial [Victivallales bacterium]|nr:RsmD family RNA methyltransferase [Victivallales bacterium]
MSKNIFQKISIEIPEITIDKIVFGGNGIGKNDGKITFIPSVIDGEKLEAEIYQRKKNFDFAFCKKILKKSSHRIYPECPHSLRIGENPFLYCSNCSYQHISYDYEIELKKQQLESLLRKIAKINDIPEIEKIASPSPLFYRRKISMTIGVNKDGRKHLGYIGLDNKTIVEINECFLAVKAINKRIKEILSDKVLDNYKVGDQIFWRWTENDGLVEWINPGPQPNKILTENTIIGKISYPASSFFQVSTFASDMLFKKVFDIISELQPEIVIDFYCGSGIFALCAIKNSAKFAIGIENDKKSIECAKINAANLGVAEKVEFLHQTSEKASLKILKKYTSNNLLVILDPPRSGLSKKVIEGILEVSPTQILYISCSPDT